MLVAEAVLCAALGLAAGLLFFRALRANVSLYLERGAGWQPLALHLARLLLMGGLMTAIALEAGASGLLAALAGVIGARAIALRAARRAA